VGGILTAIISLIRAVPSIERLFLHIAKSLNEARAVKKYEEELDHIDRAIADANSGVQDNGVSRPEWSLDPDRAPPVPDSGDQRPSVHSVSIDGGSEVKPDNKT
jgi:hypothetical protein